jgi:replicative DNA helicase
MTKDTHTPPQNIEAEQSVLGGILLDNDVLNELAGNLSADDFYKSAHQKIYSAILELSEKREPIDTITLNNHLKLKNELINVGDTSYIAFLSSSVPTAANVVHYSKIVRGKAVLRRVASTARILMSKAYEETDDIENIIDEAGSALLDISSSTETKPYYPINKLIKAAFNKAEELSKRTDKTIGVHSGFTDLDELTAGFQPSDFIIIAARPSMGKTALALNIAQNAAHDYDHSVIIFSLEMSKEQLAQRMLCTEAGVDLLRFRSGYFRDDDWPKLIRAAGRINNIPLVIDDTPAITVFEMRAKCRRLKSEGKLDLIIIDYLQLMSGKGDIREQQISDISRSLKALAKELNIPVIALSQLNRGPELREDKRPKLSDLRESGSLEQDSDVAIFIYRDEVYNKKTTDKGIAELLIRKQRNGPTGDVELGFVKKCTKFNNLEKKEEYKQTDFHDNY